jgi:dTDP-4-amino-4,6-dideoxygalactose transaminase
MNVPLIDLKAQYQSIKDELNRAVEAVLAGGHFILGPEVTKLEEEMARFFGSKYAIGVNSGTDALFLSVKAIGINEGDEVIVPAFSFFATAETVTLAGAKVVFTDIRPDTCNIDVKQLESRITPKTKAIMPVQLYGQPSDMDQIIYISKKFKLKVIEDCAQSIGAEYRGKKAGTIGDIGCLSFFPTKNLGCAGDGGMVLTDNEEYADAVKLLRSHGSSKKYIHSEIGINSRLDEIQAAVIRVKLKYIQAWNEKRRKNAKFYNSNLRGVVTPFEQEFVKHVYNQYTVRVENGKRDDFQAYLKKHGVATAVHYPIPMHKQEAYTKLDYNVSMPESEKAALEVVSLPNYPEITDEMLNHVAVTINNYK